jgi:hypothetical protein
MPIIQTPLDFAHQVQRLSESTVYIGFTLHPVLSVSTEVRLNKLPPSVWSELALDPDVNHLSYPARNDLAEYLLSLVKCEPTGLASRTAIDVVDAAAYVQQWGADGAIVDLDLQAEPDLSPKGDGVAGAAETEAEAAPVPAARDPFPSRCSACGGTGGQHFRNCPIYPH